MQGIVTGASRGLGLALTRALVGAGLAPRRRRARRGRARARGRRSRRSDRDRGRHRRPRPPPPPRRGRRRARSTCSSTTPACSARRRCRCSRDYDLDALRQVYEVNVLAPLALVQLALPRFADDARIVNLSSDAAVEAYETWGGYGSSKAALAHLTAVLAAENPGLRAYAVDPVTCGRGCSRTRSRRGHLRPAAARGERSRPAGADRGRPAERDIQGSRACGSVGA